MSANRILATINLKNIEDNITFLHDHMPIPKPIMAVIKADGYGHGAVPIGKRFEDNPYICGYAVATSEEAIELRKSGLKKSILILGYTFQEDYEELIKNQITLTLFDLNSARILSETAKSLNQNVKVHIKVDTGMSRIGLLPNSEGLSIIMKIKELPNIELDGIFTHFARADEINMDNAYKQFEAFTSFVDLLKSNNIVFNTVHCSNSAAILRFPDAHINMVRAGIVIYGLWPSNDIITDEVLLKPAMKLTSHIVHIKEIDKNTPISYGGTFVSKEKMKIATIPVGYADGYPRSLSNKGFVLINGQKAPILGRVCMDQMMVDVTGINAEVLDEVVLLGQSKDMNISAEYLGDLSGRFNYELVCDITKRVPRIYI